MEKEQLKNFCIELKSFKQKKIIKDIYFFKYIKIKELNLEMGYPIITLRVGSNTFWSVIISDKPKLHGKSIMISSFLKKIPSKQKESNQKKSQKCFLVYFDNDINDDEKKIPIRYNNNANTINEYCPSIDYMFTPKEFLEFLVDTKEKKTEAGRAANNRGKRLEHIFAEILSDKANWEIWNKHYKLPKIILANYNESYRIFYKTLKLIDFKDKVTSIITDTDEKIDKLKSKGNPKTDVAVYINDEKKEHPYTFSCKCAKGNYISGAEHSVSDYVNALTTIDADNKEELTSLLNKIVKYGGIKKLSPQERSKLNYIFNLVNDSIKEDFIKFTLTGVGGKASSKVQIAKYIFSSDFKLSNYHLLKMDDYISIILQLEPRQFETPFTFTVPSGTKSNLQIKIPSLTNMSDEHIEEYINNLQ